MAVMTVTGMSKLKKDIIKVQSKLDEVAGIVVQKTLASRKQVYMQFDDVTAIPYGTDNTAVITMTSTSLENRDLSLQTLLDNEKQAIGAELEEQLSKTVKEVFK